MTERKPVIRSSSWLMVVPQLVAMALLIILMAVLVRPEPMILSVTYGAVIYLLYSFGSRWLVLGPHRRGIKLAFAGQYAQAIEQYQQSYAFFSAHEWMDRYRFLTLMAPSGFRFAEMALMNIGYCYLQMGDLKQARTYYQKTLDQFPRNPIARDMLERIRNFQAQGPSPSK